MNIKRKSKLYQKTQDYINHNYENITKEDLENMQRKQENRMEQMGNMSKN